MVSVTHRVAIRSMHREWRWKYRGGPLECGDGGGNEGVCWFASVRPGCEQAARAISIKMFGYFAFGDLPPLTSRLASLRWSIPQRLLNKTKILVVDLGRSQTSTGMDNPKRRYP